MSQTLQALNSIIKYSNEKQRQRIDESLAMLDMGRKLKQQDIDRKYQQETMNLRRAEEKRRSSEGKKNIEVAEQNLKIAKLREQKLQKEVEQLSNPEYQQQLRDINIQQAEAQLEKTRLALQNAKAETVSNLLDDYRVLKSNEYQSQSEAVIDGLQQNNILPPILFTKVAAKAADQDFKIDDVRTEILNSYDKGSEKKYIDALIGKKSKYGDAILTGIYNSEFNRVKSTGLKNNTFLMETLDDIAGDIANDKNLQQLAVNSGIQSQAILNSLYQIDAIQKSRKQDLRDIQSGQVQRTLNRIATEDINRVFRDQFSEEARKRNLFFNPQGLIPETEMLPQETIDEFLKQRNPKTGKKFTLEDLYK
jgi:hypothetical protein